MLMLTRSAAALATMRLVLLLTVFRQGGMFIGKREREGWVLLKILRGDTDGVGDLK